MMPSPQVLYKQSSSQSKIGLVRKITAFYWNSCQVILSYEPNSLPYLHTKRHLMWLRQASTYLGRNHQRVRHTLHLSFGQLAIRRGDPLSHFRYPFYPIFFSANSWRRHAHLISLGLAYFFYIKCLMEKCLVETTTLDPKGYRRNFLMANTTVSISFSIGK